MPARPRSCSFWLPSQWLAGVCERPAHDHFFTGGKMDFLVMLEEGVDLSPVLARVDSVPSAFSQERCDRDVVTLYGVPKTESLAPVSYTHLTLPTNREV